MHGKQSLRDLPASSGGPITLHSELQGDGNKQLRIVNRVMQDIHTFTSVAQIY